VGGASSGLPAIYPGGGGDQPHPYNGGKRDHGHPPGPIRRGADDLQKEILDELVSADLLVFDRVLP